MKLEDYIAQREAAEAVLKKLQADALEVFPKEVQALFDRHPVLEFVSWTQYAPYFNDGDPCTFSVHEAYINGISGDYCETRCPECGYEEECEHLAPYIIPYDEMESIDKREDESYEDYNKRRLAAHIRPEVREAMLEAIRDAKKLIGAFSEDTYESMFGDGVQVVLKRDGIEVEGYNHD